MNGSRNNRQIQLVFMVSFINVDQMILDHLVLEAQISFLHELTKK